MPLRVFNNLISSSAQRLLGNNGNRVGNSIQTIASGLRVNKASDDIGSFAVSENLRSDVRVLQQATRNANDGISLFNAAEGGLNEISSIIIRLRELASQAATDTLGIKQRQGIQLEFDFLIEEIDRTANTAEFAGQKLLDGSLASDANTQFSLTVGLNSDANNIININQKVDLTSVTTASLGIDNLDITASDTVVSAIDALKTALQTISQTRGKLGAIQNTVLSTVSTLGNSVQNLNQAQSTLRDADIGQEFAQLTRSQILLQTSAAMVGQANLISRSVLRLLQ